MFPTGHLELNCTESLAPPQEPGVQGLGGECQERWARNKLLRAVNSGSRSLDFVLRTLKKCWRLYPRSKQGLLE